MSEVYAAGGFQGPSRSDSLPWETSCDLTKVFGAGIKSREGLQSCWERWQTAGFPSGRGEEGEEGAGREPGKMAYRMGWLKRKQSTVGQDLESGLESGESNIVSSQAPVRGKAK